jgi:predicted DNA binding CopG/RHH family protein
MIYMVKDNLDAAIMIRISTKEREALKKEAGMQGRTLANYIKWLLATHQDREKKKG